MEGATSLEIGVRIPGGGFLTDLHTEDGDGSRKVIPANGFESRQRKNCTMSGSSGGVMLTSAGKYISRETGVTYSPRHRLRN
jgi:hypothetical protein